MTVRLTSAAFGAAPGETVTLSADEEAWLVSEGYAHVEPVVEVGPTATYTPAQDPTLSENREDPGTAYQFGTEGVDALPSRVYSVTPDEGPAAGGTVVEVRGDNFTAATGVTFDAVAGTAFTLVSDDLIRVTTPAGTAGPADVVVVDPQGNGTFAGGFTYTA